MSEDKKATGTFAGAVGKHPVRETLPLFLAPTTTNEVNTVRPGLFPIACWRLDDVRFEFDSSFIKPETAGELRELAGLRLQHPGAVMSIFGHADPVGNDRYNKVLSGRRATAMYGLLTRDVKLWEKLYGTSIGDDNWGLKSVQVMLAAVGFDPGPPDGLMGDNTRRAIGDFEVSKGLPRTGTNNAKMRAALFEAYMDAICIDEFGKPFRVQKTDFLARGADADGKGDYQGCSEFNPVLMFSAEEDKEFKKPSNKAARDEANAPNRRVMILLFPPEKKVDPAKWPCPKAKDESTAACEARFFADHKVRRTFQESRREYEKTKDTFACRFYDRLVSDSPCEKKVTYWVVRILEAGTEPFEKRKAVANTPFVVTGAGGPAAQITGTTDALGILRIQVFDEVCKLKLDIAGRTLLIDANSALMVDVGDEPARRRLVNLGYGRANVQDWSAAEADKFFRQFQKDRGIPETGAADAATKAELKKVHGS